MSGEDLNLATLSPEERLVHKNWKARLSCFQDTSIHPKIDITSHNTLKAIFTENNVTVLEAGLSCLLENYTETLSNSAAALMVNSVINKQNMIASTRTNTKNYVVSLILSVIQLEKITADNVVSDISQTISNPKTHPKVLTGCMSLLKEIVGAFGTKVCSPKLVIKILPSVFEHRDANVRVQVL